MQRILNLGDRAFEQLLNGRDATHLHPELRQHLLCIIGLAEEFAIDHRHYSLIQESEPGYRKRGCSHRDDYVRAFSHAVDSRQPAAGQQVAQDREHDYGLNDDEASRDQKVANTTPENQSDRNHLVPNDCVSKRQRKNGKCEQRGHSEPLSQLRVGPPQIEKNKKDYGQKHRQEAGDAAGHYDTHLSLRSSTGLAIVDQQRQEPGRDVSDDYDDCDEGERWISERGNVFRRECRHDIEHPPVRENGYQLRQVQISFKPRNSSGER